jgi:transcriptional regulator with XRE-family HTH domain
MNRIDYEFSMVINALKEIIKNRKITYKEIGEKVGVTADAIKKNLSRQNSSFTKIIKICEALDITLYDLLTYAHKMEETSFTLTAEQEKILIRDINLFHVFIYLYVRKGTIQMLGKTKIFTPVQLSHYLQQLQKIGLLNISKDNKLSFAIKGRFFVKEGGPLYEYVLKNTIPDFIKQITSGLLAGRPKTEKNFIFRFNSARSTQKTAEQFVKDLGLLIEKFLIQSEKEGLLFETGKLQEISLVAGVMADYSWTKK